MPRMLPLRSAVLHPDDREFARGTRNVPNPPLDLDQPEGQTKRTEFARVRSKLMKQEVQRKCQRRFKLNVWSGRQDLGAFCRVGARALLKQLSKPNSATIVPGELAKTVKTGNPGHQLCLVIFDARRLVCLTAASIVVNKFRIR
jgi:hypothetical protein